MRLARAGQDDQVGLWRKLKRLVVFGALSATRAVVEAAPRRWDGWLAHLVQRLVRFFSPGIGRRIEDHLRLIYGARRDHAERHELAETVAENLGLSVVEFMRLGRMSPDELRRTVRCYGRSRIERLLAAGRRVIVITAHYGNFELMGAYLTAIGLPTVYIARASDADLTEQLVHGIRATHGVEVVHKSAWRDALRAVRGGRILGILADQAVMTGGVMADFLGRPAASAIGPVMLARQSDAVIVPVFITRDANQRMTVAIHRPFELPRTGDAEADLREGVRQINEVISRQIEHRPVEWHWMHRRWKTPTSLRNRAPRLRRSVGD